jgi:hypothetical protein
MVFSGVPISRIADRIGVSARAMMTALVQRSCVKPAGLAAPKDARPDARPEARTGRVVKSLLQAEQRDERKGVPSDVKPDARRDRAVKPLRQ